MSTEIAPGYGMEYRGYPIQQILVDILGHRDSAELAAEADSVALVALKAGEELADSVDGVVLAAIARSVVLAVLVVGVALAERVEQEAWSELADTAAGAVLVAGADLVVSKEVAELVAGADLAVLVAPPEE